jgi:CRP-like cAMP-binding protein
MPHPLQTEVRNRLLKVIPQEAFESLQPHLDLIDLALKQSLVEPNVPNDAVYFLESGLGSVVAQSSDGETVEVGHVGREGMAGYHVLLMTPTSTHRTFMQSMGSAFKVPVDPFMARWRSTRGCVTCSFAMSIPARFSLAIRRSPTPVTICMSGWPVGF